MIEAFAGKFEHLQERQQKADGALGALILVDLGAPEPIAAARCHRVVERHSESVDADGVEHWQVIYGVAQGVVTVRYILWLSPL